MRAGRPRHDVGARRCHAERQARGDPFGDRDHVGPHARVLDREHLPAASHPRLHFVGDEQDAVLLRQLAEPLDELIRRHDVATLALNWLDDERRHLVRGHQMQKNLILDEVEAFSGERGGSLAVSKKSSFWRSQDKLSVEMIEDRVNA